MSRRTFLKGMGAGTVAAGLGSAPPAAAFVPAHNWDRHDWGTAPPVRDRLNQGPFPQYPPEEVLPGSDVVMATTPSDQVVPGYGKGLVTYVTGDFGGGTFAGVDAARAIEAFAEIPMGQQLYVRPTWRELQKRRGRLDPDEYWKVVFAVAKERGKRVGFRVMMSDPDVADPALPDFVLDKVPMVKLEGEWKGSDTAAARYKKVHQEPRYDHPFFQEAFRELVGLLSAELDGSPLVEYVDTFMYGFWGEGHTWPFRNNPFPDYPTAERTFVSMFETQIEHWKRTPLVTNTQPDFSRVGNSELVDRTIRSHNWLRTDTIFIENEQIEAISNRPPWVAAVLEVGMSDGSPESLKVDEGVTLTDNVIAHVMDVGANYWSLWNWHRERAENVMGYYRRYPEMIDAIARRVGYRVRPSFVWHYDGGGRNGLVIGFANDGIAGVPGVLRVGVRSDDGKVDVAGGLDPGYPLPGRIRQALLPLPPGTDWKGLKLHAELEVKGVRHPVRWACRQKLEDDGTLRLRPTPGLSS
jgi:TAT (twin-arginine translocation) pathway signal sequence